MLIAGNWENSSWFKTKQVVRIIASMTKFKRWRCSRDPPLSHPMAATRMAGAQLRYPRGTRGAAVLGAPMTPCRIRSDQFESRCRTCGAHWDHDDEAPPCPRQPSPGEIAAAINKSCVTLVKKGTWDEPPNLDAFSSAKRDYLDRRR